MLSERAVIKLVLLDDAEYADFAGFALVVIHFADQAKVVRGDVEAVCAGRISQIRSRIDEDRVARRGAVNRGLDRIARRDLVDGSVSGGGGRHYGGGEQ